MKKSLLIISLLSLFLGMNIAHAQNQCTLQNEETLRYVTTLEKTKIKDFNEYDHYFCCIGPSGVEVCDFYSLIDDDILTEEEITEEESSKEESTSENNSDTLGGTVEDPYPDNQFGETEVPNGKTSCTNIFMDSKTGELNEFGEFVQGLFTLIKIAAPVIVIVLSTIDYIKAISATNADELKKANSRTMKRIVIGLLIFFLPFLLDILFHLFGLYDLSRCNIG